jgi:urate oxidase
MQRSPLASYSGSNDVTFARVADDVPLRLHNNRAKQFGNRGRAVAGKLANKMSRYKIVCALLQDRVTDRRCSTAQKKNGTVFAFLRRFDSITDVKYAVNRRPMVTNVLAVAKNNYNRIYQSNRHIRQQLDWRPV